MTAKELLPILNTRWAETFTLQQLKTFVHNHGINSGRTGRFEKGQKRPPGSGAKGPNKTSFKKGRPASETPNYIPIGTTRVTRDGYLERKVTDDPSIVPARRWVPEHRLLWEVEHGAIPSAHVIVFLDGDPGNLVLDNLRCVHRGVLGIMNKKGLNNSTGEARKAAVLTCEIELKANRRSQAA